MKLAVPGSIYFDALDPNATGVPGESGWPEPVSMRQVGFGQQVTYEVPAAVALEIVDHIEDRAEGLSGGVDPAEAAFQRRAVAWCQRARGKINRALQQEGRL